MVNVRRAAVTAATLAALMVPAHAIAAPSSWRPVPHGIRAQFRADGIPLRGACRIRYGDTTVIRCSYRGRVTTWTS